jgi:hypothetical protein
MDAWEKFARARIAEAEAIQLIDDALAEISGVEDAEEVVEAPGDRRDLEDDEVSPA